MLTIIRPLKREAVLNDPEEEPILGLLHRWIGASRDRCRTLEERELAHLVRSELNPICQVVLHP